METINFKDLTIEGQVFNRGTVAFRWEPISLSSGDPNISDDRISYEIEYTENWDGDHTDWHTLERRIPFATTEYVWNVGTMIKSENVRIRIRSVASDLNISSPWSISATFAINIFKLLAPAIVSPLSGTAYSDSILIIFDETLTSQTYNQKVRYTLEYSSKDREIDWTIIVKDLPPGQNVVRWNIEEVPLGDDYILRLTASDKDTDQFAYNFVYNLIIRQSGLFYIDTKPPDAILEVEGGSTATNKIRQTINIFAEDNVTEVEKIQVRECNADSILALGVLDNSTNTNNDNQCPDITDLSNLTDFGKPIGSSSKIQWELEDKSGLKKIEALLSDSGGNTSVQIKTKNFLNIFNSDNAINDILVSVEQRESFIISEDTPPSVSIETQSIEVIYIVTSNGDLWILDPYARLIYTVSNINLNKIFKFGSTIYLFGYDLNDNSAIYRHDGDEYVLLNTFSSSIITSVAEFSNILYIGFNDGSLWTFNGVSFAELFKFDLNIQTLHGDHNYLYIGFNNSDTMSTYDGNTIISHNIDDTVNSNQIYSTGDTVYMARSNGKILKGEKPIWDSTFNFDNDAVVESLTIRKHNNQSATLTNSGLHISGATVRI